MEDLIAKIILVCLLFYLTYLFIIGRLSNRDNFWQRQETENIDLEIEPVEEEPDMNTSSTWVSFSITDIPDKSLTT